MFNNDSVDGSFGVTSPIFLDQLTPPGSSSTRSRCPTAAGPRPDQDHMVTSFSSKSELALNLSTDGQ